MVLRAHSWQVSKKKTSFMNLRGRAPNRISAYFEVEIENVEFVTSLQVEIKYWLAVLYGADTLLGIVP